MSEAATIPAPGELLMEALISARRRLRLLNFFRYGCIAGLASIVLLEIVVVMTGPGLETVAMAGALAFAATVISAATAALALTPGLREVAGRIDERLNLADRLVTALQFLDEPSPAARLVVADARAHFSESMSARTFAFEAPFSAGVALAIVVAVPALFALSSFMAWRAPLSGLVGQTAGVSDAQPTGNTSNPANTRAAAQAAPGSAVNHADALQAPPSVPARDPIEDRTRAASETPSARSGNPSTPAPPSETAESRRVAMAGAARDTQPTSGQSAAATSSPVAMTGRAALSAAPGRQAADGSGRGAGTPSNRGQGTSGGISAGQPTSGPAPPRTPAPGEGYAIRYRGAWNRAEAALAREDVPTDLRAYVRQYFVAIRPSDSR